MSLHSEAGTRIGLKKYLIATELWLHWMARQACCLAVGWNLLEASVNPSRAQSKKTDMTTQAFTDISRAVLLPCRQVRI